MMFVVTVYQRLSGYVGVEADSIEEAIEKADHHFNTEGNELPDMEDIESLTFEVEPDEGNNKYYLESI